MNYLTLSSLLKCSKAYNHSKIRIEDLNDTECLICSYIYSNENCSQDAISISLRIDKTTIGKSIDNLERKNCVIRTKDKEDKRINRISLTDIGRSKTKRLIDLHDSWLKEVFSILSLEEKKQFESYCTRLLIKAEELIEDK